MKKFYNSTFSTLLLLCGLMVSLIACSNDGGDDPDGPQLKVINLGEFDAGISSKSGAGPEWSVGG